MRPDYLVCVDRCCWAFDAGMMASEPKSRLMLWESLGLGGLATLELGYQQMYAAVQG